MAEVSLRVAELMKKEPGDERFESSAVPSVLKMRQIGSFHIVGKRVPIIVRRRRIYWVPRPSFPAKEPKVSLFTFRQY